MIFFHPLNKLNTPYHIIALRVVVLGILDVHHLENFIFWVARGESYNRQPEKMRLSSALT